jgi:aarF domain-containing kinase
VQKVAKRRSNISLYADELGRGFVGELDYNIEAANASKFLVLIWSCLANICPV